MNDFSQHGYEIIRELGHNRAGGRITYLAKEINTNATVVLKQFQFARTGSNWSQYQTYEREIRVLQDLNHPSIPRYLDSFQTRDGFCIIQEYKQALSLATSKKWQPEQVKQIALSVLDILKYLQTLIPPVIHRDLKPENILVDESLNVYLVDFGFATASGEVAASSVVKGTLGFMPPEQMFNRQLSTASDLYSLGATLICLLTATPSLEVGSLINEKSRLDFKGKIPRLSPEFSHWLEKMVEPNYQQRYQSAAVAFDALISLPVRPTQSQQLVQKLMVVGGILAASLTSSILAVPFLFNSYEGKVIVTTDPEKKENLTEVSMKQERIYFGFSLGNLRDRPYTTSCQMFDGHGILVAAGESSQKPPQGELKAWCWYDFKPGVDAKGSWRFKFYLDGKQVGERKVILVDS